MSTDIQFTLSFVSALDICLTSFGDVRTVSARICDSADLVSRDLPGFAARLTLCPRDLPGLRIRLTTVPCILPERLELTWCHRDLLADQTDHSPLNPASLRLG